MSSDSATPRLIADLVRASREDAAATGAWSLGDQFTVKTPAYVVEGDGFGSPQASNYYTNYGEYELSDLTQQEGILLGHTEYSGLKVEVIEDVNGDGLDDLLVSEYTYDFGSGEEDVGRTYIVYGDGTSLNPELDLEDVADFYTGEDESDAAGRSTGSGDFNDDGYYDVVVAAPFADPNGDPDNPGTPAAGEIYVVFTGPDPLGAVDVDDLDGSTGFVVGGIATYDNAGWSIDACDLNGDGADDLLIGAPGVDENGSNCGAVYVVYGSTDPFPIRIDLADLDGGNGGKILGLAPGDRLGWSVTNLGDINGDDIDDCMIGAPNADPGGEGGAGECYVVYGDASGLFGGGAPAELNGKAPPFANAIGPAGTLDLASLNGTNGFRIVGADVNNYAGRSVSSAGDVNGDGFLDLVIGADGVDLDGPYGFFSQGAAYVVFGTDAGFAATLDLGDLDGTNGFRLRGDAEGGTAQTGYSVASAGDFNGDGYDDLIIGALRARSAPFGQPHGAAYVVFGSGTPFAADFDLTTLDGSNGFRINGAAAGDYAGSTVAGAGDINGDGFDDIAISAFGTNQAYVIYGRADRILGTAGDDVLTGAAVNDRINALGGEDIVFGQGGNDILDGGPGNDYLIGRAGNDRLLGRLGPNQLQGGEGDDIYVVENNGDSIVEFAGEGTDTVETALASYVLRAANVENLTGTSNSGQGLRGNALDNRIAGGTGNDTLVGLLGNDTYVVLNAGDSIVEAVGQGSDTVETALASYVLNAANVENLTGTSNAGQQLRGNALDNRIAGGTGNDTLVGLQGNDIYVVRNSGDSIVEAAGQGTDTVETALAVYFLNASNVENLTYTGGGDFSGVGNALANVIAGGAGNDLLNGGLGADTLIGGAGRDYHLFDSALGGGNVDTIVGFVSGTDRILLDDAIFAIDDINTTDRLIWDQATGALSYDADGSGAGAAVQFASLGAGAVLVALDIVVI